jgi:hypothetical protein
VFTVDGGAAKLKNRGAKNLVRGEVEFLLRVVAEIERGRGSGLEAIGADDALCRIVFQLVFNEQVLTKEIELISVESGLIGALKSFSKLYIEDLEAEATCGIAVLNGLRQAKPVSSNR